MEIYDIVKKLIGEISPIGETNVDNKRFDNLKLTTQLITDLINDVAEVGQYANRPEFSMSRAGKFAEKFLNILE
jgi:hypothetical protein